MLICEDCGTIIDQANFWVHKHNSYVFLDPKKILSESDMR